MAASATDLMDCPVCLSTYTDAQLLPACGHTFCRECIESILGTANWRGQAKCPTCRSFFRAGDAKPNFALRQLLADAAAADAAGAEASAASSSHAAAPSLARSVTRDLSELADGAGAGRGAALCRLQPESLISMGVPRGLAHLMAQEDAQIGLRIFLLDNSGSTQTCDGHYWENGIQFNCSRWEEIKRMSMEHAEFNARVGTACEFVLLNGGPPPQKEGRDFVRVGGSSSQEESEQVAGLRKMLDSSGPTGVTPLSDRLVELRGRIRGEYAELISRGQRVVLVVVTDGMPTSAGSGNSTEGDQKRFVENLKKTVIELPVHVVIRLVTDSDSVVEFYNKVDEEIELNLEVLDDFASEAKEIRAKGNGWLVYTQLLHKIREGGTFMKLLDMLDERMLTPVEISILAQLVLRQQSDPPFPSDPDRFLQALEKHALSADPVYDPLRKRLVPPVDINAVAWRVLPWKRRIAHAMGTSREMWLACALLVLLIALFINGLF